MSEQRARELADLGLVAAGAVPGALLRWQLQDVLTANLLGCLVLGVILGGQGRRRRLMLLAGIGFCGSLTTFCSWMLELARALDRGAWLPFSRELLLALLGGLAALVLGLGLGQRLFRR
ncbi:MAG: CrcB family protein [Synechococcaceae cyanobacterium]|nr:CrcB family protein [Synechococcaceae cyanobacterium]